MIAAAELPSIIQKGKLHMEYGLISVLPPVLTIILAFVLKNVYVSLFVGILSSYLILDGSIFGALNSTINGFVGAFSSTTNVVVMGCILTIGALTVLSEKVGGIDGFVNFVTKKSKLISGPKSACIFTYIVGCILYNSGTVSTMVTGAVSRPICEAQRVSHEKTAYIVDTTCMPVCLLIPLSGWGAVMLAPLIAAGVPESDATSLLIKSLPYDVYAIIVLLMIPILTLLGKDFGPMKKAELRARTTGYVDDPKHPNAVCISDTAGVQSADSTESTGKARYLVVPLVTMIVTMIATLIVTGGGSIVNGSGTQAVLWGPHVALFVLGAMVIIDKKMTFTEYLDEMFSAAGKQVGMSAMLMLTYALGTCISKLGTGAYLANLFSSVLSPAILPIIIFLLCCVMSFATGTSTGTFNIMMLIAVPLAISLDANLAMTVGAVFGGALFGDHLSIISDTTILTCASTGCDIPDHIKTQLPYGLFAAALTVVIYFILGLILY